jgi:hypothetical protein
MADYYPVLARAVTGLSSNDAPARRDLYARARTIVGEQMRRGGRDSAADMLREQAALEAAIGRVEDEARAQTNGKTAAPHGARRAAVAPPPPRANAVRSLSRILQAVEVDEASDGRVLRSRLQPKNVIRSPLPAIEQKEAAPAFAQSGNKTPPGLGQAPNSVGTMLLGLTYVVAALAFAGVTCIRCSVWLAQGVIGYPAMLGVMAFTLALFIAPPVAIFRKTSSLPTIDGVFRFIYGRSRGLL